MRASIDVRGQVVPAYKCTCGMVVRGNGARRAHQRKHARVGEHHRQTKVVKP